MSIFSYYLLNSHRKPLVKVCIIQWLWTSGDWRIPSLGGILPLSSTRGIKISILCPCSPGHSHKGRWTSTCAITQYELGHQKDPMVVRELGTKERRSAEAHRLQISLPKPGFRRWGEHSSSQQSERGSLGEGSEAPGSQCPRAWKKTSQRSGGFWRHFGEKATEKVGLLKGLLKRGYWKSTE